MQSHQEMLNTLVNEIFIGLEDAYAKAETTEEKEFWVIQMDACEQKMQEIQNMILTTEIKKEA